MHGFGRRRVHAPDSMECEPLDGLIQAMGIAGPWRAARSLIVEGWLAWAMTLAGLL